MFLFQRKLSYFIKYISFGIMHSDLGSIHVPHPGHDTPDMLNTIKVRHPGGLNILSGVVEGSQGPGRGGDVVLPQVGPDGLVEGLHPLVVSLDPGTEHLLDHGGGPSARVIEVAAEVTGLVCRQELREECVHGARGHVQGELGNRDEVTVPYLEVARPHRQSLGGHEVQVAVGLTLGLLPQQLLLELLVGIREADLDRSREEREMDGGEGGLDHSATFTVLVRLR